MHIDIMHIDIQPNPFSSQTSAGPNHRVSAIEVATQIVIATLFVGKGPNVTT